jgi:alpha-tubulin suppressor-like RCC1 family protein
MFGCGDNTFNQLGADWSLPGWSQSPTDILPTQIPTSFVTANTIVGTIPSATVLISPSSTLYGWGAPGNLAFPQVFSTATQINGVFAGGVENIAAGYQYSVIGLSDGTYYGMGANAIHTTLSNISLDFYEPIKMPLLSTYNVSYLVVGGGPTSLATAALSVYSDIYGLANTSTSPNVNSFYGYGVNDLSQLAQGTNQSQYKFPVQIRPPVAANTSQLALTYLKTDAGFAHGLALATDGITPFMYVWGSNAQGQIALRTVVTRSTMLLVDSGVIDIAAGDYHSFYIKKITNKLTGISTYTLYGTGTNTAGQLGFGSLQYSNTWLEVGAQINGTVSPLANLTVTKVWTGTDQTWILTNKGLYVMGDNTYGQLGLGANVTTGTRQPILHPFSEFQTPDIVQVSCAKNGGAHTVVITADGDVYVMGRNDNGQLGLGDTVNRKEPTQIPRTTFSSESGAVTDVVSASTAVDHTLLVVGRKDCLNNCNGRGVCNTVTGLCGCFSEYLGEDCNLYQCPTPDCNLHGVCDTSIGICVCSPSSLYSGLSCEKRRCTLDCSGRGRCDASGVCKCDAGFGGLGCQTTSNAYTVAASWVLVALLFVFYL